MPSRSTTSCREQINGTGNKREAINGTGLYWGNRDRVASGGCPPGSVFHATRRHRRSSPSPPANQPAKKKPQNLSPQRFPSNPPRILLKKATSSATLILFRMICTHVYVCHHLPSLHAAQISQAALAQFARGTPPLWSCELTANRHAVNAFLREGLNANVEKRKNRAREKYVPLADIFLSPDLLFPEATFSILKTSIWRIALQTVASLEQWRSERAKTEKR